MTLSILVRKPLRQRPFDQCLSPTVVRLYSSQSTTKPWKPPRRKKWSDSNQEWEIAWYKYWTSSNFFRSRAASNDAEGQSFDSTKPPVRMLLPPPNVTGQLHIGHALMLSIQDTLARYYRMCGHEVIWKPGTDHAGIATQSVVEKMLKQTDGVSRHDLGRIRLVQKIESWKAKYGSRILDQMRRVGISTDWSQTYYTLSRDLSRPVENAFIRLHDAGLIYRDTRMVNWSCGLGTAVSDVEVDWKTFDKRTFEKKFVVTHPYKQHFVNIKDRVEMGVLWNVAYKLVTEEKTGVPESGTSQVITVATTRPETIWGDRAIAVHPDDERYKHLHYKYAQHPLLPQVRLPIIPDNILVDPKYGTGAVKITPAHDANDYAFWKRHSISAPHSSISSSGLKKADIPLILVFDNSGKMLPSCGKDEFVGMDRLEAREPTIALLRKQGSLESRVPNPGMRVGYCSRGGGVIESVIQPQWYLATEKLAKLVMTLTEPENDRGGLVFTPASSKDEWYRWLEGMKDWCLSRQIWWGHRIPAYRAIAPDSLNLDEQVDSIWVIASHEGEARVKLPLEKRDWVLIRDEDVLDTWFSSGLLPLSTAGWKGLNPSQELPIDDQYPLTFIESGGDILFFWLIRMAMLGSWFSSPNYSGKGGKLPFEEIILHPLICDAKGRKMSKSEGNVIDPLSIIDGASSTSEQFAFPQQGSEPSVKDKLKSKKSRELPSQITGYGADNLRWTLVNYLEQTRQINFDTNQLDTTQKFFTKVQNAYHYYDRVVGNHYPDGDFIPDLKEPSEIIDMYIMSHLQNTINIVNKAMNQRKLANATKALRIFLWTHFCDVYVEFSKSELSSSTTNRDRIASILSMLHYVLDAFARLAHPIIPFITEELWQELKPGRRSSLSESLMVTPFPQRNDVEFDDASMDKIKAFDQTLELLSVLNRARSTDPATRTISKKIPIIGDLIGNKQLLDKIIGEWRAPLEFISNVRVAKIIEGSSDDNVEAIGMTSVRLYHMSDVDKQIAATVEGKTS